jgi:peptide-methionine (S)-S-oxide reductase
MKPYTPLFRTLAAALALAVFAPAHAQEKPPPAGLEAAIFAGGCFWCMEAPFDVLPGVVSTTSGYTAGKTKNPQYMDVSAGITGHTEAVRIIYDPAKVSYAQLLEVFWRNIDPTVKDRQFCDSGSQYRSGIYTLSPAQKKLADASRAQLEKTKPFKAPIVTEIQPATEFWAAEEVHQDYYKKNPVRYKFYRNGCGRDARLEELWGKPARK